MNIQILEKEILKAIKIEKKIQNDESEVETTVDTIQDSFNSLEKFVKKLFNEYREGFPVTIQVLGTSLG